MKIMVYNKKTGVGTLCHGYSAASRIAGCHRDTIINRMANEQKAPQWLFEEDSPVFDVDTLTEEELERIRNLNDSAYVTEEEIRAARDVLQKDLSIYKVSSNCGANLQQILVVIFNETAQQKPPLGR